MGTFSNWAMFEYSLFLATHFQYVYLSSTKQRRKKSALISEQVFTIFFSGGALVIFVVFRVGAYSKLGAYLNMYGILAEFDVGNSL